MNTQAKRSPWSSLPWGRLLRWTFGVAVLCLLGWAASRVDWPQVWTSLKGLPASTLWAAAGVAAFSHLLYSTYDLIGRAWTGHRLPWPRVMQVGFVCYAFNMNLGSLVGGVALRFRLYEHFGLRASEVGKILGLSLVTNWLGYAALAGFVCWTHELRLPADWALSNSALPWIGAGLWSAVAGYLALCAFSGRRHFKLRGVDVALPSWRLALLQLGDSSANWLSAACLIWLLLPQGAPYPEVLAALLVAAVAGIATHIPAGIGVLETMFIALMTPAHPQATVMAALLAYRAVYYLLPLCAAATVYFALESRR